MNIKQLLYLDAVCRYNCNITAAANELFVTQPTISTALKNLEDEYGVVLFRHEGRKMSLTSDGESFLERARILLAQVECFEKAVAQQSERNHRIQIGLDIHVAQAVRDVIFQSEWNKLGGLPLLFEDKSGTLRYWLEEGKIDAAVLNTVKYPVNGEEFESIPILIRRRYLFACKNDPFAKLGSVSFEMLSGRDFVMLKSTNLDPEPDAPGILPDGANVVMTTNQIGTVMEQVASGAALALLYNGTLHNPPPEIVAIPYQDSALITYSICFRKQSTLRKRFRSLARSFLRDEIKN